MWAALWARWIISSAARSPPSLKLRISNEDATCRFGFHDPPRSTHSPVRSDRSDCSTTRNERTPSAGNACPFSPVLHTHIEINVDLRLALRIRPDLRGPLYLGTT